MKIKICGISDAHDAAMSISAGADGLGFLIGLNYPTNDQITPTAAAAIIATAPPMVATVLVTHTGDTQWIIETCRTIGANTIQLHGEFGVADVPRLRAELPGITLIKAINVSGPHSVKTANEIASLYDALVLDTATATRIGGTGQTHDWAISSQIVKSASCPIILAGGLTPGNVGKAIFIVKPYAVDVNSGVEYPNGKKSVERIRAFVLQAKRSFDELQRISNNEVTNIAQTTRTAQCLRDFHRRTRSEH